MRSVFSFLKLKSGAENNFTQDIIKIVFKKKNLLILLTITSLVTLCAVTKKSSNSLLETQNKRSETILRELNDINSILQVAENNSLNSQQQQVALEMVEKNITSIQKAVVDIATNADLQKISTQIANTKNDIDFQFSDLKKSISSSTLGKEYINESKLPFHIISVDIIGNEPYVSVNYENHVFPLAIGDKLADWDLLEADYDSGTAEFTNDKNQHVKINLQGA
jgi:hypothetical protein